MHYLGHVIDGVIILPFFANHKFEFQIINFQIPLKISQFFMKGPNGVFEEWIPPSETDRRNQLIKPHVHSTYLKVGKLTHTYHFLLIFII